MYNRKIVSFDIDGVLNNYPKCWLDYLNLKSKSNFNTLDEAKFRLDENIYNSIKEDYRINGENSHFTIPNRKMIEVVNQFFDSEYTVIISTSRPINSTRYPDLYNSTFKWLTDEGVKFSKLLYKDLSLSNHIKILDKIIFHIDDEIKYIELFNNFKIKSYLYSYEEKNTNKITIEDLVKIINNNEPIL
jgi:5'(3')-deoxyribonucleotidase